MQIDDLPLFNQDNEANPPPAVTRVKEQIAAADGVLFVTPEHNRSIPAALKNAIDWASRPPKDSAFKGKVGAIIGTSRGRLSTAVAQSHLRTIAGCQLDALLTLPEAYINFTDTLIDVDANVTDESGEEAARPLHRRLREAHRKRRGEEHDGQDPSACRCVPASEATSIQPRSRNSSGWRRNGGTRTENSGRCTSSIRCGSATSATSPSAHFGRDAKAGKPFAGLRLLDIGCGGGLLSEPMARLGADVVGIDPSATNIEVARLHAEESNLAIDYRATTAEELAASRTRNSTSCSPWRWSSTSPDVPPSSPPRPRC